MGFETDKVFTGTLRGNATQLKRRSNGLLEWSGKNYNKIFELDTLQRISVGSSPYSIAYCPVNNCMYVTNRLGNSVSVINCNTNGVTTINVGNGPRGIAYCPTNNSMYVCNYGANNVTPIDCSTNTARPVITRSGSQPLTSVNHIAYNPINNCMYLATYGSQVLYIINCANESTAIDSINIGDNPIMVAYCPVNNCMYFTTYEEARIRVVLCRTTVGGSDTLTATISGLSMNEYIAYCPVNNYMYINQSWEPTTVFIVDCNTNTLINTLTGAGASDQKLSLISFCPFNNMILVQYASSFKFLDPLTNVFKEVNTGYAFKGVSYNPINGVAYFVYPSSNQVFLYGVL